MLVIGTASSGERLRWSGRRHDDDGPGVTRGDSVHGLFEGTFHALHDGEQVAIGFQAPLGIASESTDEPDAGAALARAEVDSPAVRHLAAVLTELGRWRSWTVVSTSLPRWRATTSVLVWETDLSQSAIDADLDDAVEGFYALVHDRAEHGAEVTTTPVLNLAAVAARRAELTVDCAQWREPIVLVPRATAMAPPA